MINQKIPYLQANIYFFTKINFALCVFLYSIKNIPYLQAKFLNVPLNLEHSKTLSGCAS